MGDARTISKDVWHVNQPGRGADSMPLLYEAQSLTDVKRIISIRKHYRQSDEQDSP